MTAEQLEEVNRKREGEIYSDTESAVTIQQSPAICGIPEREEGN